MFHSIKGFISVIQDHLVEVSHIISPATALVPVWWPDTIGSQRAPFREHLCPEDEQTCRSLSWQPSSIFFSALCAPQRPAASRKCTWLHQSLCVTWPHLLWLPKGLSLFHFQAMPISAFALQSCSTVAWWCHDCELCAGCTWPGASLPGPICFICSWPACNCPLPGLSATAFSLFD